jgi:hypothetical protein
MNGLYYFITYIHASKCKGQMNVDFRRIKNNKKMKNDVSIKIDA